MSFLVDLAFGGKSCGCSNQKLLGINKFLQIIPTHSNCNVIEFRQPVIESF